jgi:ribokinase
VSKVLVVGSINMDLVMRVPRFPQAGETLTGGAFAVVPGGKGANQAAAAARLGSEARLVGAVGADQFGEAALANLQRQGVDVAAVRRLPDAHTGVAMIIVEPGGRNTILVASSANGELRATDVQAEAPLFAWANILVLQCEVPLEATLAAIRLARANGRPVLFNVAPAPAELPEEALAVDWVVVNEQEAAALTGILPADVPSALEAALALRRRGAQQAIVTLGALGCVYAGREGTGHIPAPQVEAVDTTAAGDAFVGALATALARGEPLSEALLYANCAGALAVTKLGAQSSLPDAASVAALLRQFRGE